jgi:nascent polypeptide-associated complex subunit alpha
MKINPKQLEKMARKMGIDTQAIDATEVIIKTPEKEIIISNPTVAKVNMMGQDSWQVTGEASERSTSLPSGFTEEDVNLVKSQTGASEEDIKSLLDKNGGDIADAILKLRKK